MNFNETKNIVKQYFDGKIGDEEFFLKIPLNNFEKNKMLVYLSDYDNACYADEILQDCIINDMTNLIINSEHSNK